MNNATSAHPGVPLHLVEICTGEKATGASDDQNVWRWLGKDVYLPVQIETSLSQKEKKSISVGQLVLARVRPFGSHP